MNGNLNAEQWGGQPPARAPRNDPTANTAIGHVMLEERRKRKERWKRLTEQRCCRSCIHYCFWDQTGQENGCKNYNRPDYRQNPEETVCPAWKLCRRDGRFDT